MWRQWLEERTGLVSALRRAADEPVPGGARWAYVFGSALVFALLAQAASGVVLAAFYAPSAHDAWSSVAYVQQQVGAGWVVRGLHSAGASAMVALACCHVLQVTLFGAYRRPREVNWWVGLAMMACLFAFALTGYLLPWDQKGYWATQVATNLVGATPVVGPWLKRAVLGGAEYGNLTLTHFYALHVLLLPAAMALLTVWHVALMRRHGVTPGARVREDVPFWPHQLVRDVTAMAVVMAVMLAWVIARRGAGLEAPADPASSYDARPEWYFLPLFQLLKYFPGRSEIVAAVGAPLVAGGVMAALPLIDRHETRRRGAVALVVLLGAGGAALAATAVIEDVTDDGYRVARGRAARDAQQALAFARAGVSPEVGVLYRRHCGGCHLLGGAGERRGPDLDGWSSRAWLREFLKHPEDDRFYGKTKVRGMKPVKQEGADLDALVEWVWAQGSGGQGADAALVTRGKGLFLESQCDACHGEDEGAPDLEARASPEWTGAFLESPGAGRFFARKNHMPAFGDKLSPAEIEGLVTLLREQRR